MNTLEWLQSPGVSHGDEPACTILEELSELVGINGGMAWKGFGTHMHGGPYGRVGVTLEEAVRLVFLSGVLEGLMRAEDSVHQAEVAVLIKNEIKRANEALAAAQKPDIVLASR